jgi:serine/threonine protein kinase
MELKNKQLGTYKLISLIGKGGMAEVWLANQLTLNREVAIKVISENSGANEALRLTERFEREAHSVAQLDHPSILPVIDYGNTDGYLYLAMPYVRGGSLQERIKREPLSRAQAFAIFERILGGLSFAHHKGIIHRDLKPGNILLYEDGRAVIADFGVAKTLNEDVALTQTGAAVGSPEYMAPEQFMGFTDYRSDLYSMGVILYQLLTGHTLYSGTTSWEIAMRHINDPLPLPHPLVPTVIERFLVKTLQKRPEDRFASAEEMEAAFHQATGLLSPEELQFRPPLSSPNSRPEPASPSLLPTTPLSLKSMSAPSPAIKPQIAPERVSNFPAERVPVAPVLEKKKPVPLIIGGVALLVLLIGGIVAVLVLGSGSKDQALNKASAATVSTEQTIPSGGTNASLTIPINHMNGTNVNGTGVLTDVGNNKVKVVLTITGLEPGTHFTHIHTGSCLAQGPIKYPLNNLEAGSDGKANSTTVVDVDFATVTSGRFYFNVHNDIGTPTYVAGCGEIAN